MQDAFDVRKMEMQKHMKSFLEEKYPRIIVHVIFE